MTGQGSEWSTTLNLGVALFGGGNQLTVSNGGVVLAGNGFSLGSTSSATNNRVVIEGGTLRSTNSLGNSGYNIRRGTNVFNGGVVEADRLLLTNAQGFFEFNGGTLLTRTATVSNGLPFVVGASGTNAALWSMIDTGAHVFSSTLIIGGSASRARLLVTNGATIRSVEGFIGAQSHFNQALISGSGSRWDANGDFAVGISGSSNSLVISNGGQMTMEFPFIGTETSSSNNQVVVTGNGSRCTVRDSLLVGVTGPANQLLIADNALVTATNTIILGSAPATSRNNLLFVSSGQLFVTNGAATGTLNIRSGTNRLDAGLIDVDRLVITNGLGEFEFNGGTLTTRSTVIGHGRIFTVGNGSAAATLELQGGTHVFLGGLVVANHASLTGNGAVAGALTVQAGGTLAPGASVGALAFSIAPVLQGATVMEIRKTGATLTNDQIQMAGTLAYGGLLTVTNLGPDALSAGDRFRLFVASGYSGSFTNLVLPPLAPGLTWRNDLAVDGSITVVMATSPGFSVITLSGTNLILAGTNGPPNANYTVLTATNVALPLSNWVSIATNQFGAGGQFNFTNSIAPGEPQRFFHLRTP